MKKIINSQVSDQLALLEQLAVSTKTQESVEMQIQDDVEEELNELPESVLFQAIGVIRGDVFIADDGFSHTVTIGDNVYPLTLKHPKCQTIKALKIQIKKTKSVNHRLVVYPKITHFPGKELKHKVSFQLIGFERDGIEPSGISASLKDFEFRIAGLWQFIPVCQTPCISVFRNYSENRIERIKDSTAAQRVKFMRPAHLPIKWQPCPVKPFRFNAKLEEGQNQEQIHFVQILCRFTPAQSRPTVAPLPSNKPVIKPKNAGIDDGFVFMDLISIEEQVPRFLKVTKFDKKKAMDEKKALKEMVNIPEMTTVKIAQPVIKTK